MNYLEHLVWIMDLFTSNINYLFKTKLVFNSQSQYYNIDRGRYMLCYADSR